MNLAWSSITKAPITKGARRDYPEGLWHKCTACHEIIFRRDFAANHYVCTKCSHHYPISAIERITHFLDADSFKEADANMESVDPLGFADRKTYASRLKETKKATGLRDAIVCGEGLLLERPVQLGAFDFAFMAGSMGSVVGEKIARTFIRAREKRQPAIIFSASGGARMQEGLLSLMQMAKTCAALGRLRDEGIPMISVMANPTTGGVTASFAMLGDVNIGEPGALIGFAGPRVIKQTTGQDLPAGFQTSEYLLAHGMLDLICHRNSLRDQIAQILDVLMGRVIPVSTSSSAE